MAVRESHPQGGGGYVCIFFIVNEDHMVRQPCGRNLLTSPYGQNGVLQLLLLEHNTR